MIEETLLLFEAFAGSKTLIYLALIAKSVLNARLDAYYTCNFES